MAKVVLITGSETSLGRKLVDKELGRGNRVVAPVASKSSNTADNSREDLLVLPWNRSSVFSTKTVIREAQRQFGKLDRAILLSPAGAEATYFMEMSVNEVDEVIDQSIRGNAYITRELSQVIQETGSMTLGFVLQSGKNSSPLYNGSKGFFRNFADTLMLELSPGTDLCGFITESPDLEGFADFILQYLEDLPEKARGNWLKHSDKKSLFTSLPIEKRT